MPNHREISASRVESQLHSPKKSGLGFPVLNQHSGLGCQYGEAAKTNSKDFYREPDSTSIQSGFIHPHRPGGQPTTDQLKS